MLEEPVTGRPGVEDDDSGVGVRGDGGADEGGADDGGVDGRLGLQSPLRWSRHHRRARFRCAAAAIPHTTPRRAAEVPE
ncbi:hypothetical protein [Dactylosporangium sp. NPDC048998]|uniref:hypothetical protein n=1 Tax=Dactylosporangium sp. NPDC048998 TaxID=3363976 RepID=UPI003711856B